MRIFGKGKCEFIANFSATMVTSLPSVSLCISLSLSLSLTESTSRTISLSLANPIYRVWRDSNGQSSFGQGSISPAWQQKMMQSLRSFVRCRAVKTALACDLWLPCRMSLGETMSLGFLAPYLGFELCCFVMDFGGAVEATGGD